MKLLLPCLVALAAVPLPSPPVDRVFVNGPHAR